MPVSVHPAFRVSVSAIILFQVAALFGRSLLDLELRERGIDAAAANDLSYLAVPPILLLLMFPYLGRCRDSLARLFAPHRLTLRVVGLSVALGLILRLTWWSTTTLLLATGAIDPGVPGAGATTILGFSCPPLPAVLLSLLAMVVFAPVAEEIMHRGFILHGALPRGVAFATIVSAASFAFMHHVEGYLAAFLAGLLFARQTLNYRALWGPMIAHATYNACSVLDGECFRIVWEPAPADPALTALLWPAAVVTAAGVTASLLMVGKKAAGTN